MTWVVLIRQGVFTRCYGLFASYDLATAWVRANQFEVADAEVYPVVRDEPEPLPAPPEAP